MGLRSMMHREHSAQYQYLKSHQDEKIDGDYGSLLFKAGSEVLRVSGSLSTLRFSKIDEPEYPIS